MGNNFNQTGEKISFWNLLKKYKILIPILQRDYAQGRIEHEPIRNRFLETIYDSIKDNKELNLDFIYGSVKNDSTLILIDGQQRITTIFLLHWYLANKENKIEDIKNELKKFTYETRISSREFIEKLIDKIDNLGNLNNDNKKPTELSEYIKDQSWFLNYWEKDPTIKAMLIMLDSIHNKFKNINNNIFEKLIQDENSLITFHFLELKKFELTDELYIKMNARGKLLTEFEHFKAKFIEFLRKNKENVKFDQEETYEKHFARNIDGKWTDLFWKFRDDNNLIDNQFMNYFCYITEMLYYEKCYNKNNDLLLEYPQQSSRPEIEIEFEQKDNEKNISENNKDKRQKLNFSLYQDKSNLQFLIDALDIWCNIDFKNNNKSSHGLEAINKFFNEIFSNKFEQGKKVNYFSGDDKSSGDEGERKKAINIFDRCINQLKKSKFTIFDKIILWTILKYLIVHKEQLNNKNYENIVDDNLKDLVRVIRNLLIRIRSKPAGEERYRINLNYRNVSHILRQVVNKFIENSQNINIYNFLKKLALEKEGEKDIKDIVKNTDITTESFKHECKKAEIIVSNEKLKEKIFKLEDYECLRGDLRNFLPEENVEEYEKICKVIGKVFSNDKISDKEIIRALLAVSYHINDGNYDWPDSHTHVLYHGTAGNSMKYYFGKQDYWEVILAQRKNNDINKKILREFIKKYDEYDMTGKYNAEDILDNIITDCQGLKYDWRYYFINYNEMLDDSEHLVFKWGNEWKHKSGFEVEDMFRSRINGGHISPYVRTVVKLINNEQICNLEECYQYESNDSFIKLKNGVKIYCIEKGWRIKFPDKFNKNIDELTKNCQKEKNSESTYLLKTIKDSSDDSIKIDEKDRIEEIINFIHKLFSSD